MIRVPRPEKAPTGFQEHVGAKGEAWLGDPAHADADPPKLWRWCLQHLQVIFKHRCGYLAILTMDGTVDHYISLNENRSRAYDWTNYRYASPWINSSKKDAKDILDPYEVEDDWFELALPSCQLKLTSRVPASILPAAQWTLKRLRLDHGERVVRTRQYWKERYDTGKATLSDLDDYAPLIARALRNNPQFLRPEDRR